MNFHEIAEHATKAVEELADALEAAILDAYDMNDRLCILNLAHTHFR